MAESERTPDGFTARLGPEVETVVQNSKFLGQVFPLSGVPAGRETVDALAEVRERHASATHQVWAWKAGFPPRVREGSSDDGEPSGTAGAPCLQAVEASGLTDAIVVVVRYYGGVKLGRGGLIRAYGECARLALAEAPRRPYFRLATLRVETTYEDLGQIESCLGVFANQITQVERSFEAVPVFTVTLYEDEVARFEAAANESTKRRCRIT